MQKLNGRVMVYLVLKNRKGGNCYCIVGPRCESRLLYVRNKVKGGIIMNLTQKEGQEIREFVRGVLFTQNFQGDKTIMATTYPDEGMYLLDGLGRFVLQEGGSSVCVNSFLGKLRVSQFYKLRCSAGVLEKLTDREV